MTGACDQLLTISSSSGRAAKHQSAYLILWSRVLEKQIVAQLVKKITAFMELEDFSLLLLHASRYFP
jgi:hypothetical protein